MQVKRGDIFYADLSPARGSEQGGIRPVCIIQNDVGNKYSPTVIAAAITSERKPPIPTHLEIELERPSTILCEQVRTIDKSRLMEKVGTLPPHKIEELNRKLMISLGIPVYN